MNAAGISYTSAMIPEEQHAEKQVRELSREQLIAALRVGTREYWFYDALMRRAADELEGR